LPLRSRAAVVAAPDQIDAAGAGGTSATGGLRSFDLVNWESAGHAVPTLDFGSKYDLSGGNAYIKGTWAARSRSILHGLDAVK
jgi:hypothetical protein